MNVVPRDRKISILNALVEGNSIRSIERMTGTHRDTICRLLRATGERCQVVMDEKMEGVQVKEIQLDEVWGYVRKKDRNLTPQDGTDVGSQYVFVAMEAKTKLLPSFVIGKREKETATALLKDLNKKVTGRFQLSTDSFPGFKYAVAEIFGWHGRDYGQITKHFYGGETPVRDGYGPSQFIRTRKVPIMGNPDMSKVSTSIIHLTNLGTRYISQGMGALSLFSSDLSLIRAPSDLSATTLSTSSIIRFPNTCSMKSWGGSFVASFGNSRFLFLGV